MRIAVVLLMYHSVLYPLLQCKWPCGPFVK